MNRKQNENEINLDTAKQMVMNELKQILTFEEIKVLIYLNLCVVLIIKQLIYFLKLWYHDSRRKL